LNEPDNSLSSQKEKWYFSIIDIIEALVETDRPRKYWADLKKNKYHLNFFAGLSINPDGIAIQTK